jgi:hypothetical protein
MAAPKLPLVEYLKVQRVTDNEIAEVVSDAAKEAGRMVRTASTIRGAQAKLAALQLKMWAEVGDLTKVGVGDATDAAALVQSVYDAELFAKAGVSSRYWRMALLQQARMGIESFLSRKENGITLKDRIYRNGRAGVAEVNRLLNRDLALGKSAREIAKDVQGFIDPNTPGGPRYAAMRLGRTELNNAFHTTSQKQYASNPFVEAVKWELSGSHKRPDECNLYAQRQHFRGGDPGVFKPGDVPAKPHPNCLCYTVPVSQDVDDFINDMASGKHDAYMNSLGCQYGR